MKKDRQPNKYPTSYALRVLGIALLISMGLATPAHAQGEAVELGYILTAITKLDTDFQMWTANFTGQQQATNLQNQELTATANSNAQIVGVQTNLANTMNPIAQYDNSCEIAGAGTQASNLGNYSRAGQSLFVHAGFTKGSGGGGNPDGGGSNTGNAQSISQAATDLQTECALKVLDYALVNNGTWLNNAHCNPYPSSNPNGMYVGATHSLDALLRPQHIPFASGLSMASPGALEYMLPPTAGQTANGYFTFNNGQTLSGDYLAWAVAFMFAQNVTPIAPTPNPGTTPNPESLSSILNREHYAARVSGLTDPLYRALAERTAIPQGSINGSQTLQAWYNAQVDACNVLKTPLKQEITLSTGQVATGLGLNPAEPSLANCQTIGLSEMEYNRLFAARWKDPLYANELYQNMPPEMALQEINDTLPNEEREFYKGLDAERATIASSINSSLPQPAGDNPLAHSY